jgi:hypothetical protein
VFDAQTPELAKVHRPTIRPCKKVQFLPKVYPRERICTEYTTEYLDCKIYIISLRKIL